MKVLWNVSTQHMHLAMIIVSIMNSSVFRDSIIVNLFCSGKCLSLNERSFSYMRDPLSSLNIFSISMELSRFVYRHPDTFYQGSGMTSKGLTEAKSGTPLVCRLPLLSTYTIADIDNQLEASTIMSSTSRF
jgi:hypothetical protein